MSLIQPFRGLRYDLTMVGGLDVVTSPPYDVISDEQQQHYRASSPWNVVHLEFNDRGVGSEARVAQYEEAGARLREWRASGALKEDPEPAYYPYEMEFELDGTRRTVRGLVCAVGIEDWGGSILPHEHVMAKQVEDRLGLMHQTRANLSPIYSVFAGPCVELSVALDSLGAPECEITDEQGVTHRLWRIAAEGLEDAFAGRSLMIADGHHRYTVALAFSKEMSAARGPGPWNQVMMFVVDASAQELPVLPIHRVVRPPLDGVARVGVADLAAARDGADDLAPAVGLVEPGPRYSTMRLQGHPPAVSALHSGPLAGMEGGKELVFTADAAEAERAVLDGRASAAVLLPATTAERIRAIIDRGQRMPQKSTFFWPKPRTGLVLRAMDWPAPAS